MKAQVYLSDEQAERWQAAASAQGQSLNEFIRATVDRSLAGELTPREGFAQLGRDMSEGFGKLTQRVESLLADLLAVPPTPEDYHPTTVIPTSLPAPSAYVPVGPQPWDPSCYSADLHRGSVVCNECGGSFKARA